MSQEGFLTSAHMAELFFRYCERYHITARDARINVMRRLVAKKKAKYLPYPEEFLKGKRVLKIEPKGPPID